MYLLLLHDYCTAPPHTHTRNIICLVLTETFFNLYCFLLLLPLTSPQTTDSLGTQTVGKFGLSARDDFLAWVILFATVPIIGTRLTLLHTSPANTRLFYHKATEETGTGQELVATATKINSPIDIQRVILVQDGDSPAFLAPLESPGIVLRLGIKLPVAIF